MDLATTVRSPAYWKLMVLSGLLGLPIAITALGFVNLVDWLQRVIWTDLPVALGSTEPQWWLVLAVPFLAGLLVVLIRQLPGDGGEDPLLGFSGGGMVPIKHLVSILLAAIVTLACGIMLGPEAPMVAMGLGLAGWVGQKVGKGNPMAPMLIAATGGFAAISTLFGSPLAAAVLLLEALALGGPMITTLLLPGLLAAGIGALAITGIADYTPFKAHDLSLPVLPTVGQISWLDIALGIAIGLSAGLLVALIRKLGIGTRTIVGKFSPWIGVPLAGLAIGGTVLVYVWLGHGDARDMLFSGQSALYPLTTGAIGTGVGGLALLLLAKSVGYGISLGSGYRGGPIFPAIFIGAALGLLVSALVPAATPLAMYAAGMAATVAAAVRLPLAAIVILTLVIGSAGASCIPVTILAVVIAVVCRFISDQWEPAPPAEVPGGFAPEPATAT